MGAVEQHGMHPPAPLRSASNLVHDLIAVANDLRRSIDEALATMGYTDRRPVFAPLLSLVWQGAVPQGRLADALGVSPQAASQTVGLAVRAGFVAQVPNPDDGRSKLVELTDHGRAFVGDGATAIASRAVDYAGMLGARRFARLDQAVGHLRLALGLPAAPGPAVPRSSRTSIMAVSVLAADAMRSLHERMRAAGHARITAGQNLVLVHIGRDGARSSDLARVQRVSRQAISALLHDLEEQRYVRRRGDATDGRGVVFVPTSRGRRVLDDYVAGIDALEGRYAEVLGRARFDELVRSARDLSRILALEHGFVPSGDLPAPAGPAPTVRRQGELAELGGEILRWLGEADSWWLAGYLRRELLLRIESAAPGPASEAR